MVTPNQLRWRPFPIPQDPVDWVRGLFTICGAGRWAGQVGTRRPVGAGRRAACMGGRAFHVAQALQILPRFWEALHELQRWQMDVGDGCGALLPARWTPAPPASAPVLSKPGPPHAHLLAVTPPAAAAPRARTATRSMCSLQGGRGEGGTAQRLPGLALQPLDVALGWAALCAAASPSLQTLEACLPVCSLLSAVPPWRTPAWPTPMETSSSCRSW